VLLLAAAAQADAPQKEPTRESCTQSAEQARKLLETLPKGNLSRYFAERDLQQALAESGNGEYDDCIEWAEKASQEVLSPHHDLKPGEALSIRNGGRIETDPSQPPQVKSAD